MHATPPLPCLLQVMPDRSKAQRATVTGHLVITMPKADPSRGPNPLLAPPKALRCVRWLLTAVPRPRA